MSAIQRLKRAELSNDVWSADPNTGLFTRNFGIIETGVLTPPAITTSISNYNPTGLDTARHLRLSSTADVALRGIVGGVDGRRLRISNIGTFAIGIQNDSISAAAANRILTPRAVLQFNIYPGQEIDLWYDGTSLRWRMFGYSARAQIISINLPAIAAGVLGYVEVTITSFPGLTAGDFVIVNPTSDIMAAGAGNGGLLNARVVAGSALRLTLIGAITSGARTFNVTAYIT